MLHIIHVQKISKHISSKSFINTALGLDVFCNANFQNDFLENLSFVSNSANFAKWQDFLPQFLTPPFSIFF